MKNKLILISTLAIGIIALSGCTLPGQQAGETRPVKEIPVIEKQSDSEKNNNVVVQASNTEKVIINTDNEKEDDDLEIENEKSDNDDVAVDVKSAPSSVAAPAVVPLAVKNDIIINEKAFSMDEVRAANNINKCWTTVNGNVYDLTSYANGHRGGVGAILSLCGTDGSSAYRSQHGGQSKPAYDLTKLLIGKLK